MTPKFFRKKRNRNKEVEPDEIFMDSQNMPKFDTQQFEGRIERPITKKTIIGLGLILSFFIIIFLWRAEMLQINQGEHYLELSKNISLDKKIIFAKRGIIYDRNGVFLAWNEDVNSLATTTDDFSERKYINQAGLSHVLGYVSSPQKDSSGFYWQKEFIGQAGVEKFYDQVLNGVNGEKLTEVNVFGQIQSENIVNDPEDGSNLELAVDSRIQAQLYSSIVDLFSVVGYMGGAGVIMNIQSGEILAIVSFPEYDAKQLMSGDTTIVNSYLLDKRHPFLNRAVSGLYAPGSIVKPHIAIGALNEGVIDPDKKILSAGSISLPNPYFPELKSVFMDWKVHGWVNMREAIAVSSDVYFYEIGGGYKSQRGIGIGNIERYSKMFGFGEKTGIDMTGEVVGNIPNPEWKQKTFNGDIWRIGDTYHTVIGQYGFQVTPVQVVRAVAAIASGGKILTPSIITHSTSTEVLPLRTVDLNPSYYKIAQEGMRMAVTAGTANNLNVPFVKVAAKTGSAQTGTRNQYINSWITGFFPYNNPKYAFAIVMEKGPAKTSIPASLVMAELLWWMNDNTPEYFE